MATPKKKTKPKKTKEAVPFSKTKAWIKALDARVTALEKKAKG